MPIWLEEYEELFKTVMREGNNISNVIFGILESSLELPSSTLTACHRLSEPSHSFLRILRYPGLKEGKSLDRPRFFAHRDIVSIAFLFTWVCGLQIPIENPVMVGPDEESEDSWRWVAPLAGHAICNLGDAMPIFTNGKLKSGRHRVVTAHGEQSGVDRVCVLVSTRPSHNTPMRAFESPVIPEYTEEQKALKFESAKVWGDGCVKEFIEKNVKGGKK